MRQLERWPLPARFGVRRREDREGLLRHLAVGLVAGVLRLERHRRRRAQFGRRVLRADLGGGRGRQVHRRPRRDLRARRARRRRMRERELA